MKPFVAVFVAVALSAAAVRAQANSPNAATVRQRLIHSILPTDPAWQKSMLDQATQIAADLRPDGSWADVDYADQARSGWKTQTHISRLLLMCRGWRLSGDAGHPDAKLLAAIHGALDFWLAHDFKNPNWWHNEIGTPELIGSSVLLTQSELTPDEISKSLDILRRSKWDKWTGQNLVWGVTNQIVRGLIENDDKEITQAYDRLYNEVRITLADGIQPDFSFHQHGDQFYSGGYGMGFAQDVPRYVSFSWSTRWQIPADKLTILNAYLLDGERWMMHGQRFDYSAIGREITRKGKTAVPRSWTGGPIAPVGAAYGLFQSVSLLAQQPIPRQDELKQFVASMRGDGAQPLIGNRQFWRSDYMAHHRPGWFASVRMFSTRLINTEIVNDEGKKSQHLADGANLLYLTGDEYLDIFPVWDWTKIPGTTAEQTLHIEDGHHGGIAVRGKTSFVGGVSDGGDGLAVMQLQRGKLTARKAWFFFDTGYLCFGCGITDTSGTDVATTINQCHLDGQVDRADHWIHHANVGYLVDAGKTTLSTDEQTGSWRDIGVGDDKPLREKVFKLWIDHGKNPADATYQYVVLPTATLDQTIAASSKRPVRILSNTPALQAAAEDSTKTVACAFAEPGKIEYDGQTIAVDQPCLLLMRAGKVSAANPENKPLKLTVRINDQSTTLQLPGGDLVGSSISFAPKH